MLDLYATRSLRATYASNHSVLVSNFVAKHIPDGLFIAEWDVVTLFDQSETRIADELEACDAEATQVSTPQIIYQPDYLSGIQQT